MVLQEEKEGDFIEREFSGGGVLGIGREGLFKNLAATGGNTRREYTVGPALGILIGPRDSVGGVLCICRDRTNVGGEENR